MTEVEPTRYPFVVHGRGMGQFWALESHLELPLSHVVGADVDPEVAVGWKDLRVPGTHTPGGITAGSFYHEGERVFWNVPDPEEKVVIRFRDGRYARLAIQVDHPRATAADIHTALGGEHDPSEETR